MKNIISYFCVANYCSKNIENVESVFNKKVEKKETKKN